MSPQRIIYVLKCPDSGAVRYVGKTDRPARRMRQHLSDARQGMRRHLYNWIRSLLTSGARPIMEIDVVVAPGEDWKEVERARIEFHKTAGCNLTNTTDGGDGATTLSDDAREKLSLRQKEIFADPKKRAAISERLKKLWADHEAAKRMTDSIKAACARPEYLAGLSKRTGKQFSDPAARARQSELMKERCKNPEYLAARTAKGKATRATPEYKQRMSERAASHWKRPGFVERMKIIRAGLNADPEFREKISKGVSESQSRPEHKAMRAEITRNNWADPEIRARRVEGMRAKWRKAA